MGECESEGVVQEKKTVERDLEDLELPKGGTDKDYVRWRDWPYLGAMRSSYISLYSLGVKYKLQKFFEWLFRNWFLGPEFCLLWPLYW